MTLLKSAAKFSLVAGCAVGCSFAYSSLSEADKQRLQEGVKQFRRKLAEFIAPTDDGIIYNLSRICTDPVPGEEQAQVDVDADTDDLDP